MCIVYHIAMEETKNTDYGRSMAAANASGQLAEKLNMDRYKLSDDDLIRQLYGLSE